MNSGTWAYQNNSTLLSCDTITVGATSGAGDGSEVVPLPPKYANMITIPPRYIGAMAQLVDPILGQVYSLAS